MSGRSLAACEQLSRAGYPTLAWINGGFDTAQKGDLPAEGDKDLRLGGIGGVSELLGWTEVQRDVQRSAGFAGGSSTIIKLVRISKAILILFGACPAVIVFRLCPTS